MGHRIASSASRTALLASIALLPLAACSGGNNAPTVATVIERSGATSGAPVPDPTPTPSPAPAISGEMTPAALFDTPVYQAALAVWRAPRVKDACASCHGPDFIDLARIGTADSDIVRRALNDGTTQAEADALVDGIHLMRTAFGIAPTDPRSFRPLQPGGAVLPGATVVERDLALGEELQTVLPTAASAARIATLADAQRARDELLAVDFDTLKVGVALPLWSADIFHGAAEGTMNDWVADLPRIPKAATRAEFTRLQNAYLRDPSNYNFWRLYAAVSAMTEAFPGITPLVESDRASVEHFTLTKYRAALIGQHALRTEALGRHDFLTGQVPFAPLATDPALLALFGNQSLTFNTSERLPKFLPNPLWGVGDVTRVELDPTDPVTGKARNASSDPMRDTVRALGFPQFVIDSIDPAATTKQQESDIQLAWFMLGLRLDPGLQRVNQSNSTLVGEYLLGEMWTRDYFIHRTLVQFLRQVVRSYRPEASAGTPPPFNLRFNYFAAYNRAVPTRWNSKESAIVSADTKAQQLALFKQITGNMFRMALLLHEDALDRGLIAPYGNTTSDGDFDAINAFFNYAGLPGRAEDDALLRRVAAKAGKTLAF